MHASLRIVFFIAGWLGLWSALSAQEMIQWKFEVGSHPMADLRSIPFSGQGKTIVSSPCETTLIVRESKADAVEHWDCYDLPAMKQISSFDGPKNWDWERSSIGSRFAGSLVDQELVIVDLATGKQVASAPVRTFYKPHILFDKAVWFESGELLTLPQLSVVRNHPLATNLIPFDEPEGTTIRHVWHVAPKRVVVNGLAYNENLQPVSSYLGAFTSRDLPEIAKGQVYGGATIVAPGQGKPAEMTLYNPLEGKVVAVADSDPVAEGQNFHLHGFRGGLVGITPSYMHIATFKPDRTTAYMSGDLNAYPLMHPPLITLDGKRQRIRWLAKPAEERIQITFRLGYEFSNNEHTFWLDDAQRYLSAEGTKKELSEQVRKRSGVPRGAAFEEVVSSYKARNRWWIGSYAKATDSKFTGVPIEIPLTVIYYRKNSEMRFATSLILDMPEETLKQIWIEAPRTNTDSSALPQEGPNLMRALASNEPAPEIAPVAISLPERPVLSPLPARLSTQKVENFTWVHRRHVAQLKLIAASILVYFFCLTLCARIAEAFNRPTRLIGPFWLSAALASLGIAAFSLFSDWLLDILTASELGASPLAFVLRWSIVLVAQLAFGVWIFGRALAAPKMDTIVIFIVAYIVNAAAMTVFMILLFTGGGA